jgi:hypothetical protein
LREIALVLSQTKPELADPSCRISFKSVFVDNRATPSSSSSSSLAVPAAQQKSTTNPSLDKAEDPKDQNDKSVAGSTSIPNPEVSFATKNLGVISNYMKSRDEERTLEEAKFMVGDFLDVAIALGGASNMTDDVPHPTPPRPQNAYHYSSGGSGGGFERGGPPRDRRGGGGFGGGGPERRGGFGGGGGAGGRFNPYSRGPPPPPMRGGGSGGGGGSGFAIRGRAAWR